MRELTHLENAVDSRDPEIGLAAAAALRQLVEELEELHVDNARAAGWSWQAIAGVLGVTRQSVHKKHHVRRRPAALLLGMTEVGDALPNDLLRRVGVDPGDVRRAMLDSSD